MQQQEIQLTDKSEENLTSREEIDAEDAVSFLKKQHREVEELFAKLEGTSKRATKTKDRLFEELAEKLILHTKIEESILYPIAQEAEENLILEAYEEHDNVKTMIRKIKKVGSSEKTFDAKITVLKELVTHHVKEEEEELFPKCVKALGKDLIKEIGKKMRKKYESFDSQN